MIFDGNTDITKDPRLKHKNIGFLIRLKQRKDYPWETPIDKPIKSWSQLRSVISNRAITYILDKFSAYEVDVVDLDTGKVIGSFDVLKTNWFKQARWKGVYDDKAMGEIYDDDDDDEALRHDLLYEYPRVARPDSSDYRKKKSVKPKSKRKVIKKCRCKK